MPRHSRKCANYNLSWIQADDADLQSRLALLHAELFRAEAQIDLIKDLLLREQSI